VGGKENGPDRGPSTRVLQRTTKKNRRQKPGGTSVTPRKRRKKPLMSHEGNSRSRTGVKKQALRDTLQHRSGEPKVLLHGCKSHRHGPLKKKMNRKGGQRGGRKWGKKSRTWEQGRKLQKPKKCGRRRPTAFLDGGKPRVGPDARRPLKVSGP